MYTAAHEHTAVTHACALPLFECRIDTQYAEPTLVAAHRALLAAALQDPRNTMFVLLSESCAPIYHPAVVWAQLISESHISRVGQGMYNGWRWHGYMHTDHLWGQHFRKSSQWSSLTRMHALLAIHDEHVWPQFAQFCRTLVRRCRGWCIPWVEKCTLFSRQESSRSFWDMASTYCVFTARGRRHSTFPDIEPLHASTTALAPWKAKRLSI